MDFLKKDFGQKLRLAMKAAGLNQADLSKLMDVNQSAISNWCSGKDAPKQDKLPKLFDILAVDESYFLGQESNMASPAFTLTEDQLKSIGKAAAAEAIQAANAPIVPKLDSDSPQVKLESFISGLTVDEAEYLLKHADGLIQSYRTMNAEMREKQKSKKIGKSR